MTRIVKDNTFHLLRFVSRRGVGRQDLGIVATIVLVPRFRQTVRVERTSVELTPKCNPTGVAIGDIFFRVFEKFVHDFGEEI